MSNFLSDHGVSPYIFFLNIQYIGILLMKTKFKTDACIYTCSLCINGLVQERRNSIANALELHLSCTNPPIGNTFMQ